MITLSVPEMNCGHCKASVEAALKPVASQVEVDLAGRRVQVGGLSPEAAIAALDQAGFAASLAD